MTGISVHVLEIFSDGESEIICFQVTSRAINIDSFQFEEFDKSKFGKFEKGKDYILDFKDDDQISELNHCSKDDITDLPDILECNQ